MDVLLTSILPFIGILVVLVVIHELGHFITAKLSGVQVLEFGIGYPPKIWGKQKGETEYTINLLPLGGFVRLLGEEDPSAPRSLAGKPAWIRLVVMGAGSFMNFVLAIVLFTLALMIPKEIAVGQAVISQVVPGSPAAMAGLKPGDIVESIEGRKIENTADVSYNIRLRTGENTEFVVLRTDAATNQTSRERITVKPRWDPPPFVYEVTPGDDVAKVTTVTGYDAQAVRNSAGIKSTLDAGKELTLPDGTTYTAKAGDTVQSVAKQQRIPEADVVKQAGLPDQNTIPSDKTRLNFTQGATGIQISAKQPFTETRSYGPIEAFKRGWTQTFDSLKLARNQVYSWIKGAGSAPVSGPIGIAQATGEVVDQAGWRSLVDLAALLSINLAILNILPLPMLDGGRMAFVVIEIARRGRRISPQKEAMVHFVGMVALLILVVVLSYFDVARIVRGDTLFR